ncbi:MAG: TatD family hydrolase [Saprospiraceae bacterium]|jgi:TatD DNase family protein
MRIIETHAHLYLKEFSEDIDSVIKNALKIGVEKIYLPNIDEKSLDEMVKLCVKYPEYLYPMIGIHPCSVQKNYKEQLDSIITRKKEASFCAVGEIGIDLYWDQSLRDEQIQAFKKQVEWAVEWGLPIVIHSREATDLIIECLEEWNHNNLKGIFHCFTGTVQQGRRIMDLGFYLGIGGVVTFKNGGLDKVLPALGTSHLVLETDAPYLSPVPNRGKRNEPINLIYVLEKLSLIFNCSKEEIAKITWENSEKVFQN